MPTRRSLVRILAGGLGLAAAAALTAGAPAAGAATPPDLHKVNFANRAVPGSTCFASSPIRLHNGHGTGGRGLVVNIGAARYGDLNRDGRDEAFVLVNCSTGGGTAASDVLNSFVVYTGTSAGGIRTLGVITAAHRWRGTQTPLLEFGGVRKGIATVREFLYSTADADCCPTFRAVSTYTARGTGLVRLSTRLPLTAKLVTGQGIGRTRLGQTPAQLKASYPGYFVKVRSTSTCTVYRVGAVKDFGDPTLRHITAFVRNGRVVELLPASSFSATNLGAGAFAPPGVLRRDYPGRVVIRPHNAFVHLAHSWLRFRLTTSGGLTFTTTPPAVFAAPPGGGNVC